MMAKRKDTTPPIGEHLLTLREAAEVLRLSTRTVREYKAQVTLLHAYG